MYFRVVPSDGEPSVNFSVQAVDGISLREIELEKSQIGDLKPNASEKYYYFAQEGTTKVTMLINFVTK
jgi:hypothetical protein